MEIKAFKAYRFNKAVVGNDGDCIAPPYDVINAEQQDQLYAKNDFNMVRIIKGKETDSDSESNNKYTRAAQSLNRWIEQGALKKDEKDTIYAYVQNFTAAGENFTRSGFIALGKLEEFGTGVQPHEKTLDGPKADRLNLTRATQAQFGLIFMLYDDKEQIADKIIKEATKKEALTEFVDEENVSHAIYAIDDPNDIAAIEEMINDKEAVIADGHHRYETALNYRRESQNPNADYRMMTFINMHNEGLVVLPTHRLVGDLENFDMAKLIKDLENEFEITTLAFSDEDSKIAAKDKMFELMKADFDAGKNSFGVYGKDGAFYKVTLKSSDSIKQASPDLSAASQSLDVSVLHTLILDKILGIGEAQLASQSNLKYIKDIGDAITDSIEAIDSGDKQVVFFMNSTKTQQVRDVAAAGEKMPQKSTFFYPKVFTGLTINKL